jgi:hypothetical protein
VPIQVAGLALLFPQESGSLAMFAAILRASSRVSNLAAPLRLANEKGPDTEADAGAQLCHRNRASDRRPAGAAARQQPAFIIA